jgi:hypothetical protein
MGTETRRETCNNLGHFIVKGRGDLGMVLQQFALRRFAFLFFLMPAAATAQWYVEAFIGPVKIASHDVEIRQPARQTSLVFHDVAFHGNALDQPLYYGIRVGSFSQRRNWLGFEIEFIHNKAYASTTSTAHVTGILRGILHDARIPINVLLQDFSFSHGDNLALANAVLQTGRRKLTGRGRLGIGLGIPHTESTFEGEHQEQFDVTFPAVQIALGFTLAIWHQARVLSEYKLTYSRAGNVRIAHGHADTQFITHHFVAGVGYVF